VTVPDCDDHHCITCSDEGVPMTVVGRDADGLALCAADDGSAASVMTELVGPVGDGDLLLVHAGVALVRLEEAAA
jgi:hypothetical protein